MTEPCPAAPGQPPAAGCPAPPAAGGRFRLLARRWARLAWLPPALAAVLVAGALAWAALEYAGRQGRLLPGHPWWRAALRPDARWTLPVLLALWLAALGLYWWPRRGGHPKVSAMALLTMVAAGAALGEASFTPCAAGQAPVVAPLSWVLMLFTGSLESRFGPGTGCPGPMPLALQLARLLCLGATFVGVAAAVAVLWRREIDRQKTRFLGELTVITGLDAMTVALVDKFVTESSGRRVVLVEPDPNHPLLEEVRATGARVIVADPRRPESLRWVLLYLNKPSARRVFALHPGAHDNEQILAAVREVLGRATRRADHHPHLVARIDDPRHADTWRAQHISSRQPWLEDAISPCETTATFAVRAALGHGARNLVLCGDTTLTLAILIETARVAWEESELAAARRACPGEDMAGRRAVPSIVLMAERAGDLRREFNATISGQLRAALPEVKIASRPWQASLLAYLDAVPPEDAACSVVVITDGPSSRGIHEAGRVARLHPRIAIYAQSFDDSGPAGIAFDNLHQFHTGFLVDGALPMDTWTRLARHNHERYRLRWPAQAGSPGESARGPWEALAEFYREDNIRQIRQILASAVTMGRLWRPLRAIPPGSMIEFTESELEALTRAEHERWYTRRIAANWHAPQAHDALAGRPKPGGRTPKVNASVVPWQDLPPAMRRQNTAHIAAILAQLEAIGYAPTLPDSGPAQAAAFARRGEVRATRLDSPRVWESSGGTAMVAEKGDWRIRDGYGHERTVRDPEFRASHRHLGGDRWVRTGTILAWRVPERTVVRTLEGPAVAAPGDWIVQGQNGERWPVPAAQFELSYSAAPGTGRPAGGHRPLSSQEAPAG